MLVILNKFYFHAVNSRFSFLVHSCKGGKGGARIMRVTVENYNSSHLS